jgi:hypothetical protein
MQPNWSAFFDRFSDILFHSLFEFFQVFAGPMSLHLDDHRFAMVLWPSRRRTQRAIGYSAFGATIAELLPEAVPAVS